MGRKEFSDEYIRARLLVEAPIENYFIFSLGLPDEDRGSVYFCSEDGQIWTALEEDNNFSRARTKYLKSQGVPVFQEVADMASYADRLRERVASKKGNPVDK